MEEDYPPFALCPRASQERSGVTSARPVLGRVFPPPLTRLPGPSHSGILGFFR